MRKHPFVEILSDFEPDGRAVQRPVNHARLTVRSACMHIGVRETRKAAPFSLTLPALLPPTSCDVEKASPKSILNRYLRWAYPLGAVPPSVGGPVGI